MTKAIALALSAVAYFMVLMTLITLSGPSMRPDGICCDEGISTAWGIGWLALGLFAFVFFMAREVQKLP